MSAQKTIANRTRYNRYNDNKNVVGWHLFSNGQYVEFKVLSLAEVLDKYGKNYLTFDVVGNNIFLDAPEYDAVTFKCEHSECPESFTRLSALVGHRRETHGTQM